MLWDEEESARQLQGQRNEVAYRATTQVKPLVSIVLCQSVSPGLSERLEELACEECAERVYWSSGSRPAPP